MGDLLEGSKEDNIFHNEASLIRLAALQANQWFLCPYVLNLKSHDPVEMSPQKVK